MPSNEPLPTIAKLRRAGGDALVGERDIYGDRHAGSIYDNVCGPMAVLLYRESDVDRDNFKAIYFDDADGDDLTCLIQGPDGLSGRYAIPRILDTAGQGLCQFARPVGTAGGGALLAGSRIQLTSGQGSTSRQQIFEIAEDVVAEGEVLSVPVPIVASTTGPGVAVNQNSGALVQLLDQQYDPLWQPVSIVCADGTTYESADAYRGRVRGLLTANRNGYYQKMLTAVNAAGAKYLVAFSSQTGLPADVYTDDDTVASISSITQPLGSSATLIVTESPHRFATGQDVTIEDVVVSPPTSPPINGNWEVTVISPTSFTIPQRFGSVSFRGGAAFAGAMADYGLNALYVADANYGSTASLINQCTIAFEAVRGLGADAWVGGIQTVALTISLCITLRDNPLNLDLVPITRAITQALIGYFAPTSKGYLYKANGIAGAVRASHPAIQTVSIPYTWAPETVYTIGQLVFKPGSPQNVFRCTVGGQSGSITPVFPSAFGATVQDGDAQWTAIQNFNFGIFVNGIPESQDPVLMPGNWPPTLNRYVLPPGNISVSYGPPI